jgi:hypothetical protein
MVACPERMKQGSFAFISIGFVTIRDLIHGDATLPTDGCLISAEAGAAVVMFITINP